MRPKRTTKNLLAMAMLLGALASCKSKNEIAFNTEEGIYPPPASFPLQLSDPIKISLSESVTQIHPSITNLDFGKLPSAVFDSSDFRPFQKPPEEVSFDWNNLPDTVFNYESLPSKPLKFEVSILETPKLVKAGNLKTKKEGTELVFEFGEPFNRAGINYISEDVRGFLWIAANNSLYRYDGENLAIFMEGQLPLVSCVVHDSAGRVWAGSYTNGVFLLDIRAGIAKHLTTLQGLGGNQVIRMIADKQNRIWLTTGLARGVNIIDESSNSLKEFGSDQGLSTGFITGGIFQDNRNKIWIAALGGGLNIVDLEKGSLKYLKKKDGLSSDTIAAVIQDNKDRMWAAAYNGELNLIDVDQGKILHFFEKQGLKKSHKFFFLNDNQGHIWIATASANGAVMKGYGIEVVDPERMLLKTINSTGGLASNDVYRIMQDRYGQIWIVTNSGLNMIKRNGLGVQHIGSKSITAILEDSQGGIWMEQANGGLEILNKATGQVKYLNAANGLGSDYMNDMTELDGRIWTTNGKGIDIIDLAASKIEHIGKEQGLIHDQVGALTKDKDGKLWMGGFGNTRLSVFDPRNNTLRHLACEVPLNDTDVVSIEEDRLGVVWTVSYTGGAAVIDQAKGTLRYLENTAGVKENCGKMLLEDEQGNMWIGTNKGIYIVNSNRDSFLLLSNREGLLSSEINSFNVYDHRIYVGTKAGLNIITPPWISPDKNWQIESMGKSRGISKVNGTFASNLRTKNGEYWWGDRGVTILKNLYKASNDSSAPATHITGIDMLNERLYFSNKHALQLNKEDTLWSSQKDTFYLSDQLPLNAFPRNLDNIKWDSVTDAYNMPVNLQLPYNNNYLRFHFAEAHLGSGDTIWYRYALEGIDKKWSERTTNTYSENYLNLPPGEYTFKVSGVSGSGWSKPVEFKFNITPPWWQTWWAYTLYFVAFFVTVWSFIKWRTKALKREKELLEEKVATRTHELKQEKEKVENASKEVRSTQTQLIQSEKMASLGELAAGIAHEIQNPLNFVNNFSEVNTELIADMNAEIDKGNYDEVKSIARDVTENQEKINHHGKRADAIVKGMLQHSRTSSGQKEPTNINALADEYLRLAYHGLRAKNKLFNAAMETDFDERIESINIIPQDIGRVLLNLYNNAFYAVTENMKQARADYEPMVSVRTRKINIGIEILVKDNGIGIPQKIVDKIFQPFFTTKPTGQGTGLGLSLSYDIVKAHGGELKVEAKEGEGSTFIIQLQS